MRDRATAGALAGIALLLVLLGGCRAAAPPGIPTRGAELPIDDARADRVLAALLDRIDARPALRGVAQVALSGPDFDLNRPQRIAVARPARLRFEVLGLFDQLAAMLVTDGRSFGFYDASTGEISRGPVREGLIWELARVDLAPHEVVGVLLGAPRPGPGAGRAGVWLEDGGDLAVAFARPAAERRTRPDCEVDPRRAALDPDCYVDPGALARGGEIFVFDGAGRLVALRVLDPDGAIRYRVRFEDHRALPGNGEDVGGDDASRAFAHRVTIRSPGLEAEARFEWKRVMFAAELSDRIFRIPLALGSRRGP